MFRDQEELSAEANLSQALEKALEASKYLIVICSPRLGLSPHCIAEIQKFRDLGRHDRIIALLIEGEPSESFPQVLSEIKHTTTDENGNTVEKTESVMPLAADIRPKPGESIKELKEIAKLRLVASVIGCSYDELRQRDLLRRNRRIKAFATTMLALTITFLGLTSWALYETHRANQEKVLLAEEKEKVADEKRTALNALNEILKGVQTLSKDPGMEKLETLLEKETLDDIKRLNSN